MKLTIYGRPYTKKTHQEIAVNRRTGSRFIRQNEQYRAYEADALWQIKQYFLSQKKNVHEQLEIAQLPMTKPVNCKALYYLPSRHKTDLLGLENATADILEKARVIFDDELIVSWDGSRIIAGGRYGGEPEKAKPRVEIEITQWETP